MAGEGEKQGAGKAVAPHPLLGRDGVPTEPTGPVRGKAVAADGAAGPSADGDPVEMMARLRLTAVESKAVVVDDEDEPCLVDPDRTFIGKVLAPNKYHIQTILAAMRPAWGNPKGLILNPAGDNLFFAEFGSKSDRDRVLEGSPWTVGRHAVLMKKYDADVQPQQVDFDRMTIWARILALPNRLMNSERGFAIAEPIGVVKKVESDALGRCWGGYMRVRVEIEVKDPLVRYVTVFSKKLQRTESFAVQYEKLPLYCFFCGLLGHTKLACLNPVDADEDGELPYSAKRILVPNDFTKKSGNDPSTGGDASAPNSRSSGGSSVYGPARGWGRSSGAASRQSEETEVSSPVKEGGRGGSRDGSRDCRTKL
ncbi:unnamed protein product [Alopecurus aequalis]